MFTDTIATFERLLAVADLIVTPVGAMHLPITAHGRCAKPGRQEQVDRVHQ